MKDLVFVKGNRAVCDSLQVAEKFKKRHAEVVYAIEGRPCSCGGKGCSKCNYRGYQQGGLLADLGVCAISQRRDKQIIKGQQQLDLGVCATSQSPPMFKKIPYVHPQNRQEYFKYLIDRDGFTLLAMGFTGKEALLWKLRYIQAFNLMEQTLAQQRSLIWKNTREYAKAIRKQEVDVIKLFVEYAEAQGSLHAGRYYSCFSVLADSASGITNRDMADVARLNRLAIIENIITNCILNCIQNQMPYRDIYQECRHKIRSFQMLIGKDYFLPADTIQA